jgi:methionyl-tRNA formyltransferase
VRVAALGRSRILLDTVRLLGERGHSVSLIATCPPTPEHDLGVDDFERLARQIGAEFVQARSLDTPDVLARLAGTSCDIGVSVNWLTRIGREAREAFPHGILNAHGGDLPRYRGNAPFAWAILNGEERAGITVHLMDDGLDTGPIYVKRFVPIARDTYIGDLYRELAASVPAMFAEALVDVERGRKPMPQTGTPLRGYPRRPSDAAMDWRNEAVHLERLVRASSEPFGGAFTSCDGQRLTVWRARTIQWPEAYCSVPGQVLGRDPSGGVAIATGKGVLEVTEVQVGEGTRVPPASVIRSLRTRLE